MSIHTIKGKAANLKAKEDCIFIGCLGMIPDGLVSRSELGFV
jgi:hypothetical protein